MVLHSPNIPMLSKNMYIIYKQRFAFTSTYLPYFLYTNNLPFTIYNLRTSKAGCPHHISSIIEEFHILQVWGYVSFLDYTEIIVPS